MATGVLVGPGPAAADPARSLQVMLGCSLVADRDNDGDSFLVQSGEKQLRIRLYYVDCPETTVSSETDARRLREQRRHFGVADEARMVHFGREAARFVQEQLTRPFTVHTAYASAMGRSKVARVYGFVTTADGKDLASLLVRRGLARAHGVQRQTPTGVAAREMAEQLADLEAAAMLGRAGIWAEADPDRLAELRAQQRREDEELRRIQKQVGGAPDG